eukprot:5249794-Amphidinium_carterae.1
MDQTQPLDDGAPPIPDVVGKPLDLSLDFRLSTPGQVWQYSRGEFHRLTRFLALCRVSDPPPPNMPYCLIAEVYMAFLAWTDGDRFTTMLTSAEAGDQFGMQLERFRCALHIASKILGCGVLVASQRKHCHCVAWTRRFGMPDMPIIERLGFQPPRWQEAREQLRTVALHVLNCQMCDSRGGIEHWRTWHPGKADSQLVEPVSVSLYLYRPRLNRKCSATWYKQAATARAFHVQLRRCSAASEVIAGVTVFDRLLSYGVAHALDVRGYIASCNGLVRRARMLITHGEGVAVHRWHFVDNPESLRPVCVHCQAVGPVNYKSVWLRQPCSGVTHTVDVAVRLDGIRAWALTRTALSHALGNLLCPSRDTSCMHLCSLAVDSTCCRAFARSLGTLLAIGIAFIALVLLLHGIAHCSSPAVALAFGIAHCTSPAVASGAS